MGQAASSGLDTRGIFRQRRRGGRFCAQVEASVYIDGNELQRMDVLLSNMSMEGIGFQSRTPLAVGSVHIVYLDVEYMWLNSHFEVIRCERLADGQYVIGGELVEGGDEADAIGSVLAREGAD